MDMTQVIMIGKLMEDPKTIKVKTEDYYVPVSIKIYRPYKDVDGAFQADIFTVQMWKGAFLDLQAAGKVGSDIVIIGRLETKSMIVDGQTTSTIIVVAEKCSFNG